MSIRLVVALVLLVATRVTRADITSQYAITKMVNTVQSGEPTRENSGLKSYIQPIRMMRSNLETRYRIVLAPNGNKGLRPEVVLFRRTATASSPVSMAIRGHVGFADRKPQPEVRLELTW